MADESLRCPSCKRPALLHCGECLWVLCRHCSKLFGPKNVIEWRGDERVSKGGQ